MLPNKVLLGFIPVAFADILGVSPKKQALYTPNEQSKWHCLLDPTIELLFEQINDDFCDCPDGSDEPGTNACEFTKDLPKYFYCANEGYREAYIENFKLNDGVCDYDICCDGSDEYKSGACPNVCDQVKTQFDDFLKVKKATVEEALETKKELEHKAHKLKQQLVDNAKALEIEISRDETRLAALKEELEQNTSSGDERDDADTSAIDTFVLEHSRKLKGQFLQFEEYARRNNEKIRNLEAMLHNLLENYNPNFNDQAVKLAVSSFADYVSNKPEDEGVPSMNLSEFSLDQIPQICHSSETNLQNVVHESLNSFQRLYMRFRTFLGLMEPSSNENKVSAPPSEKVEQLSNEIKKLEAALQQKNSEKSIYIDGLNTDYGEGDIYRAVKGQWVHKKIGEYNYKLGFLDSLYQDNTLIGRFYGLHGNSMYFAKGSKCWNGPQRSAQVDMICAPRHELISVSEPEKCQYKFLMGSPLACKNITDEEIAAEFKVDHALLNI